MTTASKLQEKTREQQAASTEAGIDSISRGSIITMGVASAVIGLWALACLVSAMVGSGGPIALIKGWFSAISGM